MYCLLRVFISYPKLTVTYSSKLCIQDVFIYLFIFFWCRSEKTEAQQSDYTRFIFHHPRAQLKHMKHFSHFIDLSTWCFMSFVICLWDQTSLDIKSKHPDWKVLAAKESRFLHSSSLGREGDDGGYYFGERKRNCGKSCQAVIHTQWYFIHAYLDSPFIKTR